MIYLGVINEIQFGCASLIRPVEHVGIFLVFVIGAFLGTQIGMTVTSLMALRS